MKLYLSEEDVLACLTMPKAIELLDIAFRQLADGTAINHPRRRVIVPTGSVLHYMAAGTPEYFGLKAYSANPKTGAHFGCSVPVRRREPMATIAANHLGQIRTGAATGLATKYLARPDASIAGIVGVDSRPKRNSKLSRTCGISARFASGAASRNGARDSRNHAPRNSALTSGPWKRPGSASKGWISL